MNWEQVEGKWKQYSGKVREKWGKLTDTDFRLKSEHVEVLNVHDGATPESKYALPFTSARNVELFSARLIAAEEYR